MFDLSFYQNKKILLTGHTGFKGAWMCRMLLMAGADITGYGLPAPAGTSLYELCCPDRQMNSVSGDIRDLAHLKHVFEQAQPEIVIHLAAQPLVRESYREPVYTYETNVLGTVNVLECVRQTPSVKSFLNVTTDKVYRNREWEWGYREDEELNGFDPYSNSKSCSELVTGSYINSFFQDRELAVSTARAGNVIGGGDFAADRILPDCIRAATRGEDIIVRNPFSTRPYQHVLEPVAAYLMLAEAQYKDGGLAGCYNVGPEEADCLTTGELVDLFCRKWNAASKEAAAWRNRYDGGPHEAGFLKLDCSKIRKTFGWRPHWNIEKAVEKTVEWSMVYRRGGNVTECMEAQIREYFKEGTAHAGTRK